MHAAKGAPLTVGAWYHYELGPGYARDCSLHVTFVPAAASYALTLESDALGKTCWIVALEEGDAPARPLPAERLVVRGSTRPLTSDTSCPPLEPHELDALGVGAPARDR